MFQMALYALRDHHVLIIKIKQLAKIMEQMVNVSGWPKEVKKQ